MTACARQVDLHSAISEVDANEVIVALSVSGIPAEKSTAKQGFNVQVPRAQLPAAVSALRAQGLPRSAYSRMGDIFKKEGMISTPMEERGRYLYALSQELESTLSQIDGVVLARVHPVLPERPLPGEKASVSSCAVFIKYRPDFDTALYEDRIRELVLSSIPGLAEGGRAKVSVVFSPVGASLLAVTPRKGTSHLPIVAISGLCALVLLCGVGGGFFARPNIISALAQRRNARKSPTFTAGARAQATRASAAS